MWITITSRCVTIIKGLILRLNTIEVQASYITEYKIAKQTLFQQIVYGIIVIKFHQFEYYVNYQLISIRTFQKTRTTMPYIPDHIREQLIIFIAISLQNHFTRNIYLILCLTVKSFINNYTREQAFHSIAIS